MAKVRRLEPQVHFEDAPVRTLFDIEDFSGKLNADRGLLEPLISSNSRRVGSLRLGVGFVI
jgi:hypothetical protein